MKKNSTMQPEGNYYDKYNSANPIVRWMMKHFFSDLEELLEKVGKVRTVLEAGCGEGEVTSYLEHKYGDECQIEAFDISERIVKEAKKKNKKIEFRTGDIYEISGGGGYELVVCCEVLEHLEYPEKALKELLRVSKNYIILSVPREPIWRILNMARGKYLKNAGNTPGHIQHWSSKKILELLKANGTEIIAVRKPLPWTMVLIKRK